MSSPETTSPEIHRHRFPFHHITSALTAFFEHLDGEQLPSLDESAVRKQNEARLGIPPLIKTIRVYPQGSITERQAQTEAGSFQHRSNGT